MKKQFLHLSFIGLLFFSCSNDFVQESSEILGPDETVLIRDRNPDIPLILSIPRDRSEQTRSTTNLEFKEYLGMSFKTDYYPFESILNVGSPIVNIRKLEEETDNWATSRPYRLAEATQFAYHGFDRYESNSTIVNKVSSGFSINFGLFKIGKKKTMTEVFTASTVNQSTTVFGQVDVEVLDKIYDLTLNSNRIRQINDSYLHPDFLLDLYNMPVQETFQFYGGFVLSKFFTGGRATALYTGRGSNYSNSQDLENEMTKSLQASFGYKDNSASGELGFGKKYGNGSSLSNKVSQFSTSIKTIGGQYGMASFTIAKDFETVDVNLTPWLQSLNNTATHTIVDLADEGLIPLSAFILEENLRTKFERCYEEGVTQFENLNAPRLIIKWPELAVYLCTRFQSHTATSQEDITNSHFIRLFAGTSDEVFEYCNMVWPNIAIGPLTANYSISNLNFDIVNAKKVIDTVNNKMYLLSSKDRVGLSIHLGYNAYLLDTYTIRDMVENMPESEFNPSELLNYRLIAL